jgi:hypothetical protein
MLSVGFLGTREPEDLVVFEVICHIPCAAKSGFFSIHVRHFSCTPVPTCTISGIGSSAITPINGAVYGPPAKDACALKYSAPSVANTKTSRDSRVLTV